MHRKVISILFSICLFTIFIQLSCSSGEATHENKQDVGADSSSTKGKNKIGEERIPVEVATVKKGDVSAFILLSSNLETEKMADVYSRAQGLVDSLFVEEGDFVKKNQVLLSLDADEYRIAERQAFVSYQKQKNAFERANAMFEKQLLSKEEFEQAKYMTEAEELAWEQAKLNLDYTQIKSPISGVVAERACRLGDRIQPADKLFAIINNEEMIAVLHVPEKEIERVRKDQAAYITSDNLPERKFPGWVKRVSPAVDPQSGTFKVTIGVRNTQNLLRPGMFVNAHIITDTHPEAILIPKMAIVYDNENLNVFVVRDSVAQKITLKSGYQDPQYVESLSEIQAGEKIIVVGQSGLKDQSQVKVVMERENI